MTKKNSKIFNKCIDSLQEYLKKLKPWYSKSFNWQPLNRIRDYFGESIGIYFAFVGEQPKQNHVYISCSIFFSTRAIAISILDISEYHTIALIVPAILGIFQYFLAGSYVPYFCAFYVIWMMVRNFLWSCFECDSFST